MSESSFLSRRTFFRIPNALLILLVVFFLVPFALRGARLSLRKTENNVKDWLPSDFRETQELQWFSQYFAGERFVLATWEGSTAEDQRLQLFASKLRAESAAERSQPHQGLPDYERAQALGAELGLLLPSDLHRNWGGLNEIWLSSTNGHWYYLTPDGELFRWAGRSDTVGGSIRAVRRLLYGPFVEGKFITAIGESPTVGQPSAGTADYINPYYNNPALLTIPLIATVQTGPQLVEELSQPGGAFYPVDLTDVEFKPEVARRRAMEQLTGTLFAPAVPEGFPWTAEALVNQALPAREAAVSGDLLNERFAAALERMIAERYEGNRSALVHAPDEEQTDVWYAVFDAVGVDPPPRQTAVLLTLTPAGQEHLPYVLGRGVLGGPRGRIYVLAEEAGLAPPPPPVMAPPPFNRWVATPTAPGPELHVGGPPVDNIAIDEEGSITLVRLVGYCAALGLFLSYLCFRSFKLMVMIFFVGGIAAATSLSIVWWTGAGVDAILMSMPSLVYVLGLSSAIHLVNYYREEVETGGAAGAPERALAQGWSPSTVASLTTAIGLMSLYTSNIVPIRKFGLYAAIGVVATLALLFAYLPAALEIFTPHLRKKKDEQGAEPAHRAPEKIGAGTLADRWESVGRWIVNHHWFVTATCVLLFVGAALGLPRIQTSVQLLKMFDEDSRIIQDYAWLEEHFAKLVPMELVLRVPPELQESNGVPAVPSESAHPLRRLERVEAVDHIQRTIARAFGSAGRDIVGRAMSAASFVPPLPEPARGFSIQRNTFNRMLDERADELIASDYLRIEEEGPLEGSELWRISLRVGALSDVDYGRFVNDLRVAVAPVLEAYRYRDRIVDALGKNPADRTQVLLLGRGVPKDVGAEPILRDVDDPTADSEDYIDTQAIFASTLKELLENEPISAITWHDPASVPDFAEVARDERWGTALGAVDVVVLVEHSDQYDLDFIRQHAQTLIDARHIPTDRATTTLADGVPVVTDSGPLQVIYTGVVPVVYKAQRTLLASLVESIAWAFVLIAVVMMLLLNPGRGVLGRLRPAALGAGLGAGLVAMLPNVFPVVLIFGVMGHTGTLVDIGTMMTASVAMGIAVDDTIHFLSWLRRGLNSGLSRHDAVIQTYRRVGPAMTQTTVVGGLGLFVFALSTFTPTQRFGTLMLVLLVAALVGDLIFLPALLAGPLGRFFRPRHSGNTQAVATRPDAKASAAEAGTVESNNAGEPAGDDGGRGKPGTPKMLRSDSSRHVDGR